MLVIPMWQPHASAVALGLKKIETRPRSIKYRGLVAIHAAKKWDTEIQEIIRTLPGWVNLRFQERLGADWVAALPFGRIIAVGRLEACCPTVGRGLYGGVFDLYDRLASPLERALGNYETGRYGWVLEDVRALRQPLPYKAHQGCYQLDAEIDAALRNRELI